MTVIKRLKDLRERVDKARFIEKLLRINLSLKDQISLANFKTKKDCQILLRSFLCIIMKTLSVN